MYAKLINGTLRSAPKKVMHNNKTIFNPPEDVLKELGYLPVTRVDMPTDAPDGQHYESSWQQTETEILQVWSLADDVIIPEMPTIEERTEALEMAMLELAEVMVNG